MGTRQLRPCKMYRPIYLKCAVIGRFFDVDNNISHQKGPIQNGILHRFKVRLETFNFPVP